MRKIWISLILIMCGLTGCQDSTMFVMETSNVDIVISGTTLDNKKDTIIIKDPALKDSIIEEINNTNYKKKEVEDKVSGQKLKIVQDTNEVEIYPTGYLLSDSKVYQSKKEPSGYKKINQIVDDLHFEVEVFITQVDEVNYIIQTVIGRNSNSILNGLDDIKFIYPSHHQFSSSEVDTKVIDEFRQYGILKEKYDEKTINVESIKGVNNIDELKEMMEKSVLKIECIKQQNVFVQENLFLENRVTIVEI